MITIKNTQRRIVIDTALLRRNTQKLLELTGYPNFDTAIWITTNATIRRFNAQYRHKDKPTDILSFPFYPELVAGERIIAPSDEEKILGDIIISAERVVRDARDLGVSFDERMRVLLVHGICHLLGYDHETDEQYTVMQKRESALLRDLLMQAPEL